MSNLVENPEYFHFSRDSTHLLQVIGTMEQVKCVFDNARKFIDFAMLKMCCYQPKIVNREKVVQILIAFGTDAN